MLANSPLGRSALRQARTSMGLCTYCGDQQATPGMLSCGACRHRLTKCAARLRQAARERGFCIHCRARPAEGKGGCSACAQARREQSAARRAREKVRAQGKWCPEDAALAKAIGRRVAAEQLLQRAQELLAAAQLAEETARERLGTAVAAAQSRLDEARS